MGTMENFVQRQIMNYVNMRLYLSDTNQIETAYLFRVNNKGIKGRRSTLPKGYPDLAGYIKFRGHDFAIPIYIEVKAHKFKPNKEQLDFLRKAKANGCIAFWADSLPVFKNHIAEYCIRNDFKMLEKEM
jgi:hypothetical protein